MSLNSSQLAILKTDLAANTNSVVINGAATPINQVPHGGENAQIIANWYNQIASPSFFAYYSTVPVATIQGAISWKNFTPADPVPTDTQLNVQVWQARSLQCQGQQFNLQMLLAGRTVGGSAVVDATPSSTVQGFKDALQGLPSGAGGAPLDAGWTAVRNVLSRLLTSAEKMFASTLNGTGADAAHAAACTFEGLITGIDVINAWGS